MAISGQTGQAKVKEIMYFLFKPAWLDSLSFF